MKSAWIVRGIILITVSAAAFKMYSSHTKKIILGIENVTPHLAKQLGFAHPQECKVALVTNQTGRLHNETSTVAHLQSLGFDVQVILAPEHGYLGNIPAAKKVSDTVDPETNISIQSLYGHGTGKNIDPKLLKAINVIIVDLQDVGMRHYTYISTLYRCLQAADQNNKPVVVLDRPNPLGGRMEGPLVEPGLESFISIAPIPLRHGMTIGEIACYMNKFMLKQAARLFVVPMCNYSRQPSDFQFLAPLSPNINSVPAIYGYSFLGMIGELSPLDVGVGTEYPFQVLALPQKTVSPLFWKKIKELVARYDVGAQEYSYTHPVKKIVYEGLKFGFANASNIATMPIIMGIIEECKEAQILLKCAVNCDKAIGTKLFRMHVEKREPFISALWLPALRHFYLQAKQIFMYKPWPYIPY